VIPAKHGDFVTRKLNRRDRQHPPGATEIIMTFGSSALLWLLAGTASLPGSTQAKYFAAPRPLASFTLRFDGASHSVQVLEQTGVAVKIEPAEAQDLNISHGFNVECTLQEANGLLEVSAYADSKYHLIPADLLTYKTEDPAHVKLQINDTYLTNAPDRADFANHIIHVDFFLRGQTGLSDPIR